jgi:uncharacterized protein YecE (DUF72 family)
MKPADYLTCYATKFNTVEVDSTFYRTPSVATVSGWARKVPDGFLLAAKVPQLITHEKVLQDCNDDLLHFLDTMDLMGTKLGPLLFQFGYFNKTAFKSGKEFLVRLEAFLKKTPQGLSLRSGDPQQAVAHRGFFRPVARAQSGVCTD